MVYARGGGSANKHCFADTEIEITTKTCYKGGLSLFLNRAVSGRLAHFGPAWEITVVAIMRPRRPLRRLWFKTATDTAHRIVLQVHLPDEETVITETRSSGSVSAMRSYSTNPWGWQGWWFWEKHELVIRYSTQVEYLGNSYAFSGELTVSEPPTDDIHPCRF